jgi:hypothetical protein
MIMGLAHMILILKKVKPQAEAAKEEAEKQVLTFFNYISNKPKQ